MLGTSNVSILHQLETSDMGYIMPLPEWNGYRTGQVYVQRQPEYHNFQSLASPHLPSHNSQLKLLHIKCASVIKNATANAKPMTFLLVKKYSLKDQFHW